MQQRMLLFDTERRDQHIDRLPRGLAAIAQRAVVPGRLDSQLSTRSLEDLELQKFRLNQGGRLLVAESLQYLQENNRREAQSLFVQVPLEPIRLGVFNAVEVVDPDGRIDDHHRRLLTDALHP